MTLVALASRTVCCGSSALHQRFGARATWNYCSEGRVTGGGVWSVLWVVKKKIELHPTQDTLTRESGDVFRQGGEDQPAEHMGRVMEHVICSTDSRPVCTGIAKLSHSP